MSSSTDNQAAAVKDSNEIPPTTLSNENSSATTAQDTEDFDLDLSEEEFQVRLLTKKFTSNESITCVTLCL